MPATQAVHIDTPCSHAGDVKIKEVHRPEKGCTECLALGDTWVHLRVCLVCGRVSCCDDSPNRHATKHFHASGHPIITSAEPGESWVWCYVDEEVISA
jgi:uncharacterized UBP type Zn finger protein